MTKRHYFNFNNKISLFDLAEKIEATIDEKYHQDVKSIFLSDIKNLEDASSNDLTFLSNRKYYNLLKESNFGACIVSSDTDLSIFENRIFLTVSDPYFAYSKALKILFSEKKSESKNSISEKAKIADNVVLGFNVVIEDDVEIGENSYIGSNSIIKYGSKIGTNVHIAENSYVAFAEIGDNSIIHPGVRIGTDGFGFATNKGFHHKILHVGSVKIGENVEVGANSTIDRGSTKDTIIGDGTIIDNLVQVGHNVQMGKGCIIVAQVGIAGSTILGDYVVVGGQAGLAGHLKIESMVQIAGKSGVISDIDQKGQIVGGYPSQPIRDWHKQTILLRKMLNDRKN